MMIVCSHVKLLPSTVTVPPGLTTGADGVSVIVVTDWAAVGVASGISPEVRSANANSARLSKSIDGSSVIKFSNPLLDLARARP
jgi:hypothetical protein